MKKSIKFNDAFGRLRSVTASLALLSLCTFAHAGANIGGKIFLSSCAGCHGASEDVPGFAPDLRRFQGDELAFLSIVKNGRPGTIMSGWQGVLSDAEIMNIRSYLKQIPVADSRQQTKGYASQEDTLAAR
jgi:mono/diheme cytochrome c family protein